MAAETSIDAKVPVMLALFKLGLFYGADVFNKEVRIWKLDPNKVPERSRYIYV